MPPTNSNTYRLHGRVIHIPRPPTVFNKKTQRRFVAEIKAIAKELDLHNHKFLIFYKGIGHWWQIGGRSLLFYLYYLMPEYDLHPLKPRQDTDFFHKWSNTPGCASINNIDRIANQLISRDCATLVIQDPCFFVFELKHSFNDTEINTFCGIEHSESAHTNSILIPRNIFPGTRNAADLLNKLIFDKIRLCDAFTREHLAGQAVTASNWVTLNFIAMVNGHISPEEYFPTALKHLDFLQDWLVHIQRYNILDAKTRAHIANQTVELRSRLENDYNTILNAGGMDQLFDTLYSHETNPATLPQQKDQPKVRRSTSKRRRQTPAATSPPPGDQLAGLPLFAAATNPDPDPDPSPGADAPPAQSQDQTNKLNITKRSSHD